MGGMDGVYTALIAMHGYENVKRQEFYLTSMHFVIVSEEKKREERRSLRFETRSLLRTYLATAPLVMALQLCNSLESGTLILIYFFAWVCPRPRVWSLDARS